MTAGDKASTDASVLASLDTPIAKEITKISQLEKIQGTYLRQFFREIDDDGKMRPFFDFHIPTTYRGSSSNPNFQNIPIRDEEAKRITRSGIMPSIIAEYLGIEGYIGNKLLDWDYGAMEVRIIACYTQCPVLMNYIFDESTDMHRDNAIELFNFHDTWQLIPGKLGKKIRFEAKNGFTFPEFYGSYYRSCARNLFQKCMGMICYDGITVLEHLRATGIIKDKNKAYEEFEEWVKRVEQRFWLKYKAVKKWQEKAWSDYLRLGYVEQMFGFRCQGYMTRNDVVNYPIQGTAFHCLMWSINEINRRMKEQRMLSKMIGQIHDCCLSDLFPFEQRKLMDMSAKIATQEIREVNKWINVPLIIEWEETEINKPWGSKIEIEDND
jgi:DNA polymerase I-like protein with 3'-5' exonuclease and polymerase domains